MVKKIYEKKRKQHLKKQKKRSSKDGKVKQRIKIILKNKKNKMIKPRHGKDEKYHKKRTKNQDNSDLVYIFEKIYIAHKKN